MAESIKVCVRFKGREKLEPEEEEMWEINENSIKAPNLDGKSANLTFTYDHILDNTVT